MLKGLELNGLRAAAQAKCAAPVRKSVLVTTRAPASKHHQAFKSARPAVRANAAAPDAAEPVQSRQAKKPLEQLEVGAEYEGRVVKVEAFGAFVDFGFAKDGLVHISQLSDKYIKSANAVVQPNQTVKVRVLNVDATSGRIALTMKGMGAAAAAPADAEAADEAEEEEEVAVEEEGEESMMLQVPEGFELVSANEEPEIAFLMEEDDEEMTFDSVAAFEALDADQVERELVMDRMPVPVGELISGKVTRIEDYGLFIEFAHGGRNHVGLLASEEAKVPSSALTEEERAEYGGEVPEYIEMDVDSLSNHYQIGQEISAFVLEYNERNQLNLTQFTDWEVQADALEAADEDDYIARALEEDDVDALAEDPLSLLEDNMAESDLVDEEFEDGTVEGEIKADFSLGSLAGTGTALKMDNANLAFPSRPLNTANRLALNQQNLSLRETDFDGDEVYLDDYWQESFVIPKHALKRLGLKIEIDEAGQPQVVEKEGAKKGEFDLNNAFQTSHNARVAAFVRDLMADDEDEAELPARAMRRPVVLAAAVQNISASAVKDLRNKTGAGMMDCKKALAENDCDVEKAIEWLRKKGLSGADKKAGRVAAEGAISSYIHPGSRLGVLLEVNCETDFVAASDKFRSLVNELGMILASCPEVIVVSPEDVPAEVLAKERDVEMGKEDLKSKPEAVRAKIVEGRLQKIKDNMALLNQASLTDPNKKVSELVKEAIAAVGENIQVRRFVRFNLGEGLEKRANDFAAEVAQQTQAKAEAPAAPAPKKEEEPKKEEPAKPAVQVSASVVKQLRDMTGAGMMDCKKALAENNGDMDASVEWLRKKGLSSADKKAGRLAAEGAVIAYIHPGSRLGVLLEVNCETDFVAASDKFQQLSKAIAMQIAASPTVQYVAAEDIPAEVYAREKEIEMGREDLKNKPDAIRAKIAEGRVAKLAQDMALLPQPYLMDPSKTVEQAVKEAVAAIGEKISVRRFVKFQLGEGIEKKTTDLAAEVAAATGGKA